MRKLGPIRLWPLLNRLGRGPREPLRELDGVVVSVDYADCLALTLPRNRVHLDRILVVTTERDLATQEVCRANDTLFVTTEAFHRDGAPFNKGGGLNAGLRRLAPEGWVLVLDADIALPADFRQQLDFAPLQRNVLYGARRVHCTTPEQWEALRRGELDVASLEPDPPIHRHGLLLPTGFFHLFHAKASALRARSAWYPEHLPSAARVDTLFAKRHRRTALLPLTALHLGEARRNWRERISPPFEARAGAARSDGPGG